MADRLEELRQATHWWGRKADLATWAVARIEALEGEKAAVEQSMAVFEKAMNDEFASERRCSMLTRWHPWHDRDGRRVVGDWQVPEGGVVLVGVDVCEVWCGRIFAENGDPLRKGFDGNWFTGGGILRNDFPVLMADVLRRLFAEIDSRPQTRFVLPTRHIERWGQVVPPYRLYEPRGRKCFDGSRWISEVEAMNEPFMTMEKWLATPRPNLIPAALIRTKADAERMLPALLRVPGLRGIVAKPTEAIDLDSLWPGGMPCPSLTDGPYVNSIHLVALIGSNPWTASLADQARAAGVEVVEMEGEK